VIRPTLSVALLLPVRAAGAEAEPLRMVVADVPYTRVWAAAQEAVRAYPISSR
jgi:hypothetical protein